MHGLTGSEINEPLAAPSYLNPERFDCLLVYFPQMMDEQLTSPLAMKPTIRQPHSTVDYEFEDEKQDSELQLTWSRIMDEGKYRNLSTYTKVKVLLLCWKYSNFDTQQEVDDLKATFEIKFNYHVEIKYLDIEKRLQVRVNSIVAAFVDDHDGPNTLFIVYYAGHGKPGEEEFGDLELFGSVIYG